MRKWLTGLLVAALGLGIGRARRRAELSGASASP